MKRFNFKTLLKIFFGLVVGMSLMSSSGCSIFVNRETRVTDDNAAGTKATDNVEVGTGIEAPGGNLDND